MRKTTTAAALVAIGSTAALALAASGASASAAHSQQAAAAATTSLHGWIQVSDHAARPTSAIGLARFHGNLQAVWVGQSGDDSTLDTRSVNVKGGTASTDLRLEKWSVVNDFPQVLTYNGGLTIAFAGQRSTDITDPYSAGLETVTTSPDAKNWTLGDDTLSQGNAADGSYGSDVVDAAGNLVLDYTASTANKVSYHEGYEPISDAEQDPDLTTTPESGADVYYAGLGYDSHSQKTWAVWDSLSGKQSTEGVSAQQVLPSPGTRVHAPDTAVKSLGSYAHTGVNQRIDVAERVGGGLYASYGVGYPEAKHVALWKLGAANAKLIPSGGDVNVTDVARAPHGKLWVFWFDSGQTVIHAARTNVDATRLGAVCKVATPHNSTGVSELAGASAGPLQLFINSGGSTSSQIYDKIVLPCLSVSVSPHKVRQGGNVTVTVRDAGSPVEGAKVSFAGASDTTDKKGVVTLHVGSGTKLGSHSVRVTHGGYQTAHHDARVLAHR